MTDECNGVSFIIPAYNEESCISNAIQSIRQCINGISYEIIVVNNGSTDNTKDIVQELGIRIVNIPKNTISYARNIGANAASKDILAFIDADVRLTVEWGHGILQTKDQILTGSIITGSRYVIPENPSWIEKSWFYPLSKKTPTYINGGNLVLSKKTFNLIGGFDDQMITGEDYEFSMRATKKGMFIESNIKLRAIHDGYPKNAYMFMRREYWHGKGDFQSLKLAWNSKVSVAAVMFGLMHLLAFVALVSGQYFLAGTSVVLILIMMLAMSIRIFLPSGISCILVNMPLCHLYLASRFASCLTMMSRMYRA